ncbi:MAG: gliding motility-associated C-terminal domain-containing protein [Prevotellaceae bacterium]|jgi:gliding motility-associated-like protein|nr:gliding motility-associated C-terminal domain-containing protein [Prevotellaceae bacterium]
MTKLLLSLLLLAPASALAQIGAEAPAFSDTTKYRPIVQAPSDTTTYRPLSRVQDRVLVFTNHAGLLSAEQPSGRAARFTWQRLDTASLTFQTIWIDTVPLDTAPPRDLFTPLERDSSDCGSRLPMQVTCASPRSASALPDSVGAGYYRVLTDTLRTIDSIVICSSFCTVDSSNDTIRRQAALPVHVGVALAPADTFGAWVVLDTFRIDSIAKISQDCEFLNLRAIFYPAGINEGYYTYAYLDLWRTPRKEQRTYPDCLDCYIKSVAWSTTPGDIHKDADVEAGDEWKHSFNAYVPTPFYDAKYKVEVESYFGVQRERETDSIEAHATHAKLKLYVGRGGDSGDSAGWEEKTDDTPEDAPLSVRLANASLNAKDSATFTWELFSNLYELPENDPKATPPLLWPQVLTTDSAEAVHPAKPYQPGKYPIALTVLNRHGCQSTDTVTVEVAEYLITQSAIPPVLTPNGDGQNDLFQIKDPATNVHSVESIDVSIMNRYGQLAFSSRDVLFAWDGKLRGTNSLAPAGVYFYIIRAAGYSKQRRPIKQTLKGYFHLFNGE